jgi:hypothetical protein
LIKEWLLEPREALKLIKKVFSGFKISKIMKLAVEPKGIDLVVEPHKYTKSDAELMTKIISHYKETGELLKLTKPNSSTKNKERSQSRSTAIKCNIEQILQA